MYDWKSEIDRWVNKNRKDYSAQKDIYCSLFQKAFENTAFPNKSWFGIPPRKTSLSLSLGSIFLVGCTKDDKLWIIVDTDLSDTSPYRFSIVRSSVHSGTNIYWLEARLSDITKIVLNDVIWEHYKIASAKVINAPQSSAERKRNQSGKKLLSDFWNNDNLKINQIIYEEVLIKEVIASRRANKKQRILRLLDANKIPIKVDSKNSVFIRNPDVAAEVLENANGICTYCGRPAPFIKDSDSYPFLEVHHIIPLANNGFDSVDNAVALCPNCHRHAHFGKTTFKMELLKGKKR
jgi:5-methylcytosine-specific restriction endonuclease McrA